MADEIKYEFKTVQTVRGTEGIIASRLQKEGWELVSQDQGRLKVALNFRRPKKPLPWKLIAAGAAGAVVLATIIGVGAALEDGDEKPASAAPPTATSDKPSNSPAPTRTQSAAEEILTPQNNPELATMLKVAACDGPDFEFAKKYADRMIAFNGSIANMGPHGLDDTRYDILVYPGDKGANSVDGPNFQFEDVNVFDMNLTGDVPDAIGVNDKFRFTAEVGDFDVDSCLFHLNPAKTKVR